MTPPNPGAVYDAHGRSGSLPQAHAHVAHWPQGQQQHMLYVNPNHTNPVCLRAQQSEKAALAQWYARLSLSETEKSPIPATAIATGTATATSEVPVQQFPSVKQASVPVVADTTAIGATALTVATGATGATRIIMGPDGTTLVPPPDPAHPGCELSMPMAKAMENFSIPHCCNYLQTKDLLRDKVSKKGDVDLLELLLLLGFPSSPSSKENGANYGAFGLNTDRETSTREYSGETYGTAAE